MQHAHTVHIYRQHTLVYIIYEHKLLHISPILWLNIRIFIFTLTLCIFFSNLSSANKRSNLVNDFWQIKFEGFGARQGPLHGLPISTPYMTKDYLQLKRFQAQTNGTTYVYDFPEMFRQALERVWEEYLTERGMRRLENFTPIHSL